MLTVKGYFMGRDEKYPEEMTDEIRKNAIELIRRVNMFMEKMGWELTDKDIASGWRPKGINDATKNAAMFSKHLTGLAVDLVDLGGVKGKKCLDNKPLLDECGLWMEHPDYTPKWCHFQSVAPKSGNRFFIP